MPSATRTVRNQFTRQIVQRVAWALVKVWEALNRDAHRDSSEIVTECFGGIRKSGLIGLARDARDEGGQPLNAEHNGVARMFALLCTPDGVSRLPAAFCETVTLLAQEIERIRQLAKVELDPKLRSELDITFQTLKRHLATLLETAFLTELPFGPKMISLDPLTVERLAGVLYERWEVTRTAAQAPHFERWINRDLGMSLGFSLFDSVRAQHWKRAEVKRRRVVVIAGERGLCGAYNTNVVKAVEAMRKSSSVELDFVTIGRRVKSAAQRFNWPVVMEFEGLPEDAGQWPSSQIGEALISDFASQKCDEVVLVYTTFKSAMSQEVTQEVLLPFTSPQAVGASGQAIQKVSGKIEYDPAPGVILETLIPLLVKTKVCQAGMESRASEHAARMTAMDSATRNADDLIERLRLFYNRARQSSITRELIDIVGGAEAIK